MADRMAKEYTAGRAVTIPDMDMGIRELILARAIKAKEWQLWHDREGHDYYRRKPVHARHLKGLSRMDVYCLVRIRSGAGLWGHEDCDGGDERHHLVRCRRYMPKGLGPLALFDDKRVPDWVTWWRHHCWVGLGVPRGHVDLGDVRIVAGNLFNSKFYTQGDDGEYLKAKGGVMCTRCGRVKQGDDHSCLKPTLPGFHGVGHVFGWAGEVTHCGHCGTRAGTSVRWIRGHLRHKADCGLGWYWVFWGGLWGIWDGLDEPRRVTIVKWWSLRFVEFDRGQCLWCDWAFRDRKAWTHHLASVEACWDKLFLRFSEWVDNLEWMEIEEWGDAGTY
ncbi:hypothetical protein HOY82DRAFT_599685 [Tuber indicum]|nr:hypothetical protein HOY82DRAFT_599685 [Tuber indicum]